MKELNPIEMQYVRGGEEEVNDLCRILGVLSLLTANFYIAAAAIFCTTYDIGQRLKEVE